MNNKISWIVDASMLERMVYRDTLIDAIKRRGHGLHAISFTMGDEVARPPIDGCVIVYGSHQFTKAINPDGRYQPGMLGVNERTQVSAYMSELPLEWMMNRRAVMTTWKQFVERGDEWFSLWGDVDRVFIRPNSGFKTFAGQCIPKEGFEFETTSLEQLSSVMADTLIVISPPCEILGEFRFVVADKTVVAGSEYRWDNRLDVRRDYPPECFALAEKVAAVEWQVDIAYVVDVALTPDGPRVVELNSFSCAGLYACDVQAVVDAVGRAAMREYLGDE